MIYITLPAYNEEEGLEKLLIRIKRVMSIVSLSLSDYEVIIVDDGSQDHSKHVIQSYQLEMPLHLIHFDKNAGVRNAFNAGFDYILRKGRDGDIVITLDSDNTQNPYVIFDLLEKIKSHDLVIASRFCPGGKMVGAGYRGVLSTIASRIFRAYFRIPGVKDYTIFFRAYRLRVIQNGFSMFPEDFISGPGFSCMVNMLLNCAMSNPGMSITEVPLTLRYDLKEGGSGIKIFRTIKGYLQIMKKHGAGAGNIR